MKHQIKLWTITGSETSDRWVVRVQTISQKIGYGEEQIAATLSEARQRVPKGLLRLDRYPLDAHESWLEGLSSRSQH